MRAFVRGRFAGPFRGRRAALLVDDDGRIAALGSDKEILARLSPGSETINLEGGLVLPAFQDAHVHLCQTGRYLARPDLGRARSLQEALDAARLHRDRKKSGALFLEGYDETAWKERRAPLREELDAIEAKRPLILRRVCGHVAVGNRAALETIPEQTAGVDRTSGLLEEGVVFRLEEDFFPPAPEENREAILRAENEAFALGITTVHEIDSPAVAAAYASLDRDGALRLRVFFYARTSPEEAARLRAGVSGRMFRVVGAKVFLDGSIGGRTAALHDPYIEGGSGLLLQDLGEVEDLLRRAGREGLPIAFHAIGDRAIDLLLDGCERANAGNRPTPLHRIEHAEMISDHGLERAGRLRLRLSMQPNFPLRWGGSGGMYEMRLGAARARRLNRFASARRLGIPVAFGSDCMPLDPFYGLEGATCHPIASERLSPEEGLACYTGTAEEFVPEGGASGSLDAGKRADFLVLSPDFRLGGEIRREDLLRTVSGGEIVYER